MYSAVYWYDSVASVAAAGEMDDSAGSVSDECDVVGVTEWMSESADGGYVSVVVSEGESLYVRYSVSEASEGKVGSSCVDE